MPNSPPPVPAYAQARRLSAGRRGNYGLEAASIKSDLTTCILACTSLSVTGRDQRATLHA
jgi:hypothetical protein